MNLDKETFIYINLYSNDGIKADASANLAWEGKTADLNAKVDSSKDGSVIGAHATAITPDHGKSDITFKNKVIKIEINLIQVNYTDSRNEEFLRKLEIRAMSY